MSHPPPNMELRTNTEWKRWGKDDPLWGVSSWEGKQRNGTSPWTEEEFYAMGESDWKDYLHHWQDYGVNHESCLEVGCGAGRITRQLPKTFSHVYAVDVSEDMLARARACVSGNVEFFLTNGLLIPLEDRSVTAVFSTFVLQHLDKEAIGLSYLREMFRVLETEGTLMIQVPLYKFPTQHRIIMPLMQSLHSLSRGLSRMIAGVKRSAGIKVMRMTPYSIDKINAALLEIGFSNVQFKLFPVKSHGSLPAFVFATKK
jgi:ubiquinone/menaquinone biosynthesis C-methylase UbiE